MLSNYLRLCTVSFGASLDTNSLVRVLVEEVASGDPSVLQVGIHVIVGTQDLESIEDGPAIPAWYPGLLLRSCSSVTILWI